jgi:hypothetical protein
MHVRTRVAGVIACGALAASACSEPMSTASMTPASASAAQVASDATPTQLAVAQAVPGFGGYYIDANGAPTVLLTAQGDRDAAAQALGGFLASYGWSAADLQVREARYDYLQLNAWYLAARDDALAVSGAVLGDIDEVNNRITFGALDASALSSVANVVAAAGIPSAALSLQIRGPVRNAVGLRDRIRPAVGGIQINFFPTPASPLTLVCTIGFNAIEGTDTSFVTNSHCSNVQGGTTPVTDYYQASRGLVADPANFIAREVEDPEYSMFGAAGCPLGRRCRTSDASRAKYAGGLPFALGRIARPAFENVVAGQDTLLIDAANPVFPIVAEQMRGVVGQRLNKVGRTTGWTSGLITETCVDINITASEITQLCQDLVDAYVAGGDSGSPVFGLNTDGTAYLAGILWGSSTNLETGAVQFIMSPLAQVKAEIGDIRTFDPPVDGKKRTKKVR